MYPVLFRIGRTPIHTYSALLALGLAVGLGWAWWQGRARWGQQAGEWVVDGFLAAALGGLLGGRIGYVLAHWPYFQEHVAEAWAVWRGGLSFVGAVGGGAAALATFWSLARRGAPEGPSFWEAADLAAAATALGSAFGWMACLAGGVAYGLVAESPLSARLPDIYGIEAVRFATQPLGAAWSLTVFGLLLFLQRRRLRPGNLFAFYLAVYFAGAACLEWTRGDETLYLGVWRVGLVAHAAAAGLGLALLLGRALRRREAGSAAPKDPEG